MPPQWIYTCLSLCIAGRRDSSLFGVVDNTTTTKFSGRACAVHRNSLPVVVDKVVVVVLKFPIGGFESTRILQMPLVEIFAPVMLRKLVLQLQDRFSRESLEGPELSFGWGMDTYLVDREPVFSR